MRERICRLRASQWSSFLSGTGRGEVAPNVLYSNGTNPYPKPGVGGFVLGKLNLQRSSSSEKLTIVDVDVCKNKTEKGDNFPSRGAT